MPSLQLHHVGLVVHDLPAAIAFFVALGLTLEGEAPIEGDWVDRINGIAGLKVDVAMMCDPDGDGRIELTAFRHPPLVTMEPAAPPPNAPGLRSVMFTVDDLEGTVARLSEHGGSLIGEVAYYEDKYRLCYVRGPAGMIVALAQPLKLTRAPHVH